MTVKKKAAKKKIVTELPKYKIANISVNVPCDELKLKLHIVEDIIDSVSAGFDTLKKAAEMLSDFHAAPHVHFNGNMTCNDFTIAQNGGTVEFGSNNVSFDCLDDSK